MDVQTENTDSPPGETQPTGKIRKGFKLFGKRKPGNIFSIRSKSEGNNKSPLNRSKTLDGGGPEPPDSEQDAEKEKIQGVGEQQATEEEPMGEDGVLAAAPARTSISSACSAKSLGFLSILRGGRRGVGDRRVHTVSQPVGRQRRGIKGLFKFNSKDKDEKENQDVPPSPLLMSSRSNSVEIIKEDLTLTPKQPRSLDSPGTESSEPSKSLTTQDSSTATSPSKTVTPGNVSKTDEPIPTTQPTMVPGETSLSSLLADISSLLTFDSISGGGDIMADVEAEWGKACSAISATISDTSPLHAKPIVSSPLTAASITTTAKPSTTFTFTTVSTQPSSPMKPSSIITTLTKSSTLTTQTVKPTTLSSLESSSSVTTQPLKPVTNISTPVMSSPSVTTMKTTLTATTSAPPSITVTTTKAPLDSPSITATFNKLAWEKRTETPKTTESKPSPVAAPSPQALTKTTTPVTHSPPAPFIQSSTAKPDLTSSLQVNKAPVTVLVTSMVTVQPSPPAPLISSKMTTTEVTSAPVSVSISKPAPVTDLNKTTSTFSKLQPSSVSVPSFVSQVPPITAPAAPPVSLNGMPTPAKISPAMSSLQSQPLSTPSQVSLTPMAPSVTKAAPLFASQPKITLAPVETAPCQAKVSVAPVEIPPPISKTPVPASSSQPHPASPQPALSNSTPTCPVLSLSRDGSAKKSEQISMDGHLTSPKSPKARDVLQQDLPQIKEDKKRASHHTTGLSKIPVVGGGKAKIPVRVSQHTEEETNVVSMSMPEEASPHFNSHDTISKDKIANSEVAAAVATSKQSQEECQEQPKASTCLPRDSKIPVKHGSQIPQAKDAARTKIPVSKVPVRRAGGKPAAPSSSSTQIRK